jgi:hypothetical protein
VGVLCLGSLAYLLSSPALTGFTTAQRYSSLQARSREP